MVAVLKPRSAWTDREPTGSRDMRTDPVDEIYFHWPGSDLNPRLSDEDTLKEIQRQHMDDKRPPWWDIGYSAAVGHNGVVYDCRGFGIQGGHTKGHNDTSYGLLFLLGLKDQVEPLMVEGAVAWLRRGEATGHIDKEAKILGHSQASKTKCPGPSVLKLAKQLDSDRWWDFDSNGRTQNISPELIEVYLQVLGSEPHKFAEVWQARIDAGVVTLDEVRWKLVGVALGELRNKPKRK